MNLDSYELTGLRISLDLVNRATPGHAGGTFYAGECTVDSLRELLKADPPSVEQLEERHTSDFRALADTLREAFLLLSTNDTSAAANRLNQLLKENPATPELGIERDGRWRLHHHPLNADLLSMWTAICAEGIAREIGNQNGKRFGICDANQCDRVFFDGSRNGKRRYCSIQCQNRAKSAAFRHRNA